MSYPSILRLLVAGGMVLVASAQRPADPLERVTGQASATDPVGRAGALDLLQRARTQYNLRSARRAYDLKVTFTVRSDGQTEHDGVWSMEDVFDPRLGLRWSAKSSDGYSVTRIVHGNTVFGDDSTAYVPLRLHEARAALYDPMPSLESMNRSALRTATVVDGGAAVPCMLLSDSSSRLGTESGRRWDESEECIDPTTGLLQSHSPVPGRSYTYDYSKGIAFSGRTLPGRITVNEGGHAVSVITVESLTNPASVDPALFQPTQTMRAKGQPVVLGGGQKLSRTIAGEPVSAAAPGDTVCVFGLVTAGGQLVEAHSLQPANAQSAAAIEAARKLTFPNSAKPGQAPQQFFVFVIEKIPASM